MEIGRCFHLPCITQARKSEPGCYRNK